MTMTQQPSQRPKSTQLDILIKTLKMTTSSHDHEALNAMRLANALLLKMGTDWEDLLNSKVTLVADPFTSIPDVTPKDDDIGFRRPTNPPPNPFAHPTPQQPPRPTPPPPPPQPKPPVYYHRASYGGAIDNFFDALLFVKLDPATQDAINKMEVNWKSDNRLIEQDYHFLRNVVARNTAKPRVRRRRP